MKFSLQFVQEFCSPPVAPKEIASLLTLAGMEVGGLEKVGQDWIFDIEVTTNRYDWLSIVGIAREVSAVCDHPLKVSFPLFAEEPPLNCFDIVIEDKNDCPFYIARLLRNVRVEESAQWVQDYINHCGINSINNVVDILNYCMLKWGNPLHLFDFDKIKGLVHVRRAKDGERFLGLDGKERLLNKENLVVADEEKVIALAGVMGAKNTEVTLTTKNVLLEAAFFSPLTIRRSRRGAGIETESSYRFERRVFSEYVEVASGEASSLISSLAHGEAVEYKLFGEKPEIKKKRISIVLSRLNSYIGEEIKKESVIGILEKLGFSIQENSSDILEVESPLFRTDIHREVDVYEEILRIFGYEKVPARLPFIKRGNKKGMYEFKRALRGFFVSMGLKEIVSFSITGEDVLTSLQERDMLFLSNPLRSRENVMRPGLLSGAIEVVRHNFNQKATGFKFFELANVYRKAENSFRETSMLSVIVSCKDFSGRYLKGVIEELMSFLNIEGYEWKEKKALNFTNALEIVCEGESVGFIGKLDAEIGAKFDLKEEMFFSQCDVEALFQKRREKVYSPFSRYPFVSRDISLSVSKDQKFKEIENVILRCGRQYLKNIEIIDIYQGKNLPPGVCGVTVRVNFQAKDKTLTSEEVDTIHSVIRDSLAKIDEVTLR